VETLSDPFLGLVFAVGLCAGFAGAVLMFVAVIRFAMRKW
jgi:hypothetical protein